jgi:hypothetical protein
MKPLLEEVAKKAKQVTCRLENADDKRSKL